MTCQSTSPCTGEIVTSFPAPRDEKLDAILQTTHATDRND